MKKIRYGANKTHQIINLDISLPKYNKFDELAKIMQCSKKSLMEEILENTPEIDELIELYKSTNDVKKSIGLKKHCS